MWRFPRWVWLKEGYSGPFTEAHLRTASGPWLQVPLCLQNRCTCGLWKQRPIRRPGSGSWLHHLQRNDPGKNLNHPWSLCLFCKKNVCAFVLVKALACLQTAGFRDPVYQQHLHHLSLPQVRYFSDARASVKPTVLSRWMGGQRGRETESLLKHWKWELVVWDVYIDSGKFPHSLATAEPTLLPFHWPILSTRWSRVKP